MYDVLASLAEQFRAQGFGAREAIEKARDVTGRLVIRGLEFTPVGSLPSYGHLVAGMLEADERDFGGKYHDTIINMFANRNIHPPEEQPPQQPINEEEPLRISEFNTTPLGARLFLESYKDRLGVSDVPLKFRTSYKNDKGETFLIYDYTKDVPVTLEDGKEAVVKAQGGLVLAFDSDGKLFFKNLNLIDDKQAKDIQRNVKLLESQGKIASNSIFQSEPQASSLFKSKHVPMSGYLARENGQLVLKKSPILD